MIRLHNQNRTHTFIDVESGQFISLPKDETDKPPVNADINNNIDTFHSTGGEGTPDMPIDIVNIAEYNKMVTGQNVFDKLQTDIVFSTHNLTQTANGIRLTATSQTSFLYANDNYKYFLIKGETYTFKCKWQNSAVRGGQTFFEIRRSGESDFKFGETYWANTNEKTTLYSFTPLESGYCLVRLYAYNHDNKGLMLEDDYCDFWDIQLLKGEYTAETVPAYQSFQGKTYPYKLEDVNGVLHYGGDLPDGTADTYNRETGEFVKRVSQVVLNGTETWDLSAINTNTIRFNFIKTGRKVGTAVKADKFPYFNSLGGVTIPDEELITSGITIAISINKSRLATVDVDGFKTWLGNNPVTVQYALAEPVTYTIKQYGKTYGGQVWEYNEKPKSIQYHTNIFTDKNITMQCEVRKLGNRAMGTFYWVTENGDKIITEDGDYIMFEY